MKKWIALLLSFAMLFALGACGSGQTEPETSEEEEPLPVVEDGSTVEETPADEPEPPVEEESTAAGFTNPLTGEATETDLSANRPVAVMLNTLKKALPQSGTSDADVFIEVTEEGGITRVMAMFQDLTGVGNIGTVRSTREYFSFLAMGYDAIFCHCGGSEFGINALERNNYTSLNQFYYGDLYWRDSYRKENVGYEHSLYTSGENLSNFLAQTTKIRTTHEEGYTSPFAFTADGTPAGGQSANQVDVSFSGYKQTHFTYDEATGKYNVSFFEGEPYMDANTDTQVAVTNVIVVVTQQTTKPDGQRQEYDLSSGTGYFACGGQYIPICWAKGGETDPLTFTNTDGTPLELGVGTSYICIVDDDRPVDFA